MKRGKRGGWKRGREWGLHWMSVVETHKLPTFKHLHLKGEHIYIYITYPKKIFKSKADMFGWNKTKKHNQNSPINQKNPYRIQFPIFSFRNWATKRDLFCYSGWYTLLRETQPLESLRSHLVGRGGKGGGPWASQLLATWQDVRLCSPSSRTPQNRLVPPVLGEEEQSPQTTENKNMTAARSQDLVLFHGLHI